MRQLTSIGLLVFYLLVSVGVPVTVHYCQGQVAEVAVLKSDISCCCGDMEDDGCCENESQYVSLDTDQQVVRSLEFTPILDVLSVPALLSEDTEDGFDGLSEVACNIDLPPPKNQPLWLAHCSLTYYG